VDVVHANSVRAGLIAYAARRMSGPPFVVHVRDILGPGTPASALKSLLASRAAGIIVVSGFVAADWREVHRAGAKLARVYNPIDCAVFRPDAADGASWRVDAGIPADAPLLAVVGQITPWKRQIDALETFRGLLSELPQAHLLIVGAVKFATPATGFDNPAYLEQLAARRAELGLEDRVHLLGEREDVASIMRAADLLLAPAVGEPFGRAVAEAMATGTPAVIAAEGGAAEFMRDGIDGVVVPGGETAQWVAGCVRALELARSTELADGRRAQACDLLSKDAHARAVEFMLSGHD
jgi:glycosyltransferase involved in cell wall biosynthesis